LHRGGGAKRVARGSCDIKTPRCGKPIGKQDQYIAAYGGLQFLQFNPDGSVFVDPIICKAQTRQALEQSLLLFYTGLTRSANRILEEQRRNTEQNDRQRQILRTMTGLA